MAVTTSYSFGFVESIDPFSITGSADATSLSDGGVAVVGDHIGHTDLTTFAADGDIAGSASVIPGVDAAVTQLSDGNIVVLSDTGTDMSFRIVTTTGATVRADTSIEENGTDVLDPEVAALTGGGFVVAIQDFFGGTDNDADIRVYDSAGNLLTNFAVDSSTANDQNPSVAGLADGGFAVAWHRNIGSSNEMWYGVYNANGSVRTAPTLLDNIGTVNRNASVVALDSGGFAIAYEDNGWSTTDIDITLARFDSAGTFVDWDDITQNTSNDTGPSATVLSNGMIAVGYTNDTFPDTDTRVTLVDQNTGSALATSTIGGSLNNESQMTIAAMNNGQIAAFHTDSTAGDVVGSIRQATRYSTGDGADDTIIGDSLLDVASGNDGKDTLNGGANDDVLNGGAGDDKLIGGTGVDTMTGGLDNDTYYVDTTADVIIEAAGEGLADKLIASVSYALAAGVEVELMQTTAAGGTSSINLYGNEFVQSITGNAGDNILNGKGGADTMRGLAGNDFYYVDDAGDVIIEVAGQGADDRVIASASYVLKAGVDIERMQTTSGAGTDPINLTGNELVQTLIGNAGANILDGKGGADTMSGGDGNDTYYVDTAADIINEAAGKGTADKVVAATTYVLSATAEIEQMQTNSAGATKALNLTGNDFVQTLIGNAGNNRLDGKGGADTMNGSAGDDTYIVDNAGDVIIEGAGKGVADKVITSVSYALAAGNEIETLQTNGASLTSKIDLTGSNTDQDIFGNNGANRLDGKGGEDTMRGYGGPDTFVFSTTITSANVDEILDFNVPQDVIELESAIFTGLTEGAFISKAQFAANTTGTATTTDHRIIYETDTGNLYYDADGDGGGGRKLFGIVSDGLAVTNDDFFVG